MTPYSTATVWMVLGAIGAGTLLIRLSFIGLMGRVEDIPLLALRILRLIPAAVLAAIVAPALTHSAGTFDLGTDRFVAGVAAAAVAWRTRNVIATIAVGMGALWGLDALGWLGG
jgi:branched-subunit amino acid transport protein